MLEKYINHGFVTFIHFPHSFGAQTDAYNHALSLILSYEWVYYTDVDEFLNLKNFDNLNDFLSKFPLETESIKLPWRNFTFSGHQTKPFGLTLESFKYAKRI